MANVILLQKGDLKSSDFTNDNSNNKEGIGVRVSSDNGNLLQQRKNGLYYGIEAPPDTANLYVSSSMGDDSNPGTRAAPLKTIREAIVRNTIGTKHTIRLYENDIHEYRASWGSIADGKVHKLKPYGEAFDFALANNPRGSLNYLRSQQLVRPTLKFVPDGSIVIGNTEHESAQLARTANPLNIAYSADGIKFDMTANADLPVHSYYKCLYGSHYAPLHIYFVGCEFKLGSTFFLYGVGGSSDATFDHCLFDTSSGTKLVYIYETGILNLTVKNGGRQAGGIQEYSNGNLTYSASSPINMVGGLISGNVPVGPNTTSNSNINTRQNIYGG